MISIHAFLNSTEVMARPKAPIGTLKSPEKITKKPRNPLKYVFMSFCLMIEKD